LTLRLPAKVKLPVANVVALFVATKAKQKLPLQKQKQLKLPPKLLNKPLTSPHL
jgi:hypothetical protein